MHDPTQTDQTNSGPAADPLAESGAPLQAQLQEAGPAVAPKRVVAPLRRRGLLLGWLLGCVLAVVLVAGVVESQTSLLQAMYFARWSGQLNYSVAPGPADAIAYPAAGPFDERRGYTRLPELVPHLTDGGYRIDAQARQSSKLLDLIRRGIAPPFREPPLAGLSIRDAHGAALYDSPDMQRPVWHGLEEIPPLAVRTLLFIENRRIGVGWSPLANPAVDLPRSGKALALYLGRGIGLSWPLEGGSTLATQLEKFRHSPAGHTASPAEKLRQMLGASLAAYHEGPDTRALRSQIILDYLNTMPLGAVPGYGEVNGLAQGLSAWFGESSDEVFAALREPDATAEKAHAYREVLALLYSVHAPSYYLGHDPAALDARIDTYLPLLAGAGVVDEPLVQALAGTRLSYASRAPATASFIEHKAANAVRAELASMLGAGSLYDLDRMHLTAGSTIDAALQAQVNAVLAQLASPAFVAAAGLRAPHMLDRGDPAGVTYSVLLLEALPEGNVVRVRTDTRNGPLDVNDGTKLELGSTAKLRTMVHYLELVAQLHDELKELPPQDLARNAMQAADPITRWAALTLFATPDLSLPELLDRAMERSYSGSPEEAFFTGGGMLHFRNFEPEDDVPQMTLRQAVVRSSNLVFIRLMRDLVRFHAARLPYDARAALEDYNSEARKQLLREVVAEEERRTHQSFSYLYARHNRAAANNRLRIRIERDAFLRMTPYWRRLGFPFDHLVPSYATALGSSADRPMALAELMGILVNGGRRLPVADVSTLAFAAGTPYETRFSRAPQPAVAVIRPEIASTMQRVLGEVVEGGTARRLKGAFQDALGQPLAIGGKTGSGDNRHETFARNGTLLKSQPVSRTAVFVFYLGERWFGVITASVEGPRSGDYDFTSSLPLAALKLLAPALGAAVLPAAAAPAVRGASSEAHAATAQ